ncbi:MAG: hypothetical protein AAF481_04775 [Acidobacteriota bacterium]
MPSGHITVFQILEVLEGNRSPDHLLRLGLDHLHALCPECGEQHRKAQALYQRRRARAERGQYAAAFRRLEQATQAKEARLREDQRRLAREMSRLNGLSDAERQAKIQNARTLYRSPLVAERLLEEARQLLFETPARALGRLDEAQLVVQRLATEVYGASLCEELAARVQAHRANALRVLGELRGAEALWATLRAHLEEQPLTDPQLCAELDSLEASLQQDMRQFPAAEHLLRRAEAAYRRADVTPGVGKVLVQRALMQQLQGQPEKALDTLGKAKEWSQSANQPRLHEAIAHNRALCLCDTGRFVEAEAELAALPKGAQQTLSAEQQQLRLWLAGRIALGRGRLEEAEGCVGEARNQFIGQRRFHSAALASLDLAGVYLAQGRTYEVKRLALQTLRAFEEQSVAPESARALRLFLEAASTESLTLESLTEFRRTLELARRPTPTAS